MPATYTHHLFVKDVYKVINDDVKKKLNNHLDLFYLFGKSFDVLFFSKPRLGCYAHDNHVNLYFANIIKKIRDENLFSDGEVLSYLYGSICHYVLDSTIHPYVFYKTGKYNLGDKKTKVYKGAHDKMEYMIDAILYQERNQKSIYKANLRKEVFTKYHFSSQFNKILDNFYLDTFHVKSAHKYIQRGIRNYSFILGHVMTSRFGFKYRLYQLFDFCHLSKRSLLANYCYYIKKLDYSYLNKEHKKWYYPVDKKISYHYSFYDLYDIAIERARILINQLDYALDKDEKDIKKVLREIGNLSYATGKNADKHYVMKYFLY